MSSMFQWISLGITCGELTENVDCEGLDLKTCGPHPNLSQPLMGQTPSVLAFLGSSNVKKGGDLIGMDLVMLDGKAAGQEDPQNMELIQCLADIVGRTFTFQLKLTEFNFLAKISLLRSHTYLIATSPYLFLILRIRNDTTTQAMICYELVRFHRFLQLVFTVLPDTSTVLTMLLLLIAEASLEWSSTKASHEIGVNGMSDML